MNILNYIQVIIMVAFVILIVVKGGELKRHVSKSVLEECVTYLKRTIGEPARDFIIDEELNQKFNANPYDEVLLNELCRAILNHCGMSEINVEVAVISQKNRHVAGTFHRENGIGIITISEKPYAFDYETKATLTHECMHYFLRSRGIGFEERAKNEYLTDVATIYMGFWPLMGEGYFKQGYLTTKDLKYVRRKIGKE